MSSMRAAKRTYEPEVLIEEITPEFANQILARNTQNRHIRERHVEALARDMENGLWRMSGEAIKIAKDGTVLDGQHRLLAIVESGVTITTPVVYNLDLEDQIVMDSGRSRTFGDVLKIRGEAYSREKAALVRKIILWERGSLRSNTLEITRQEMLDVFLSERDEIDEACIVAARGSKPMNVSRSVLSLAAYLLYKVDATDAEFFFDRCIDGQDLHEGSPIYALRRALQNRAYLNSTIAGYTIMGLIIKAWNAWREGREIQVLAFRIGGSQAEPMPEPK